MDVSGTGILVAGSKRGHSGTGAGSCGSCFGHFHGQFIFTDIGLIVLVWGVCVCVLLCFLCFLCFGWVCVCVFCFASFVLIWSVCVCFGWVCFLYVVLFWFGVCVCFVLLLLF